MKASASNPLFSIVTVSYNQSQYLSQAMESVLSQNFDDYEYLIMDGGSTDGSREKIEAVSDHLAYWQSKPDGGAASALDESLKHCRGKYLMYLNSDDIFLPGALRTMARRIEQFSTAEVLYGHGYTLQDESENMTKTFSDLWDKKAYARGLVSIFQQACALRMDAVRAVGGFNTLNRTCWDGELLFDLAKAGGTFQRVNDFFAIFRLHSESISGSGCVLEQYKKDQEKLASELQLGVQVKRGIRRTLMKATRDPMNMCRKLIDRVMPKVYPRPASSRQRSADGE